MDIVLLHLFCTTELKPAGSCRKADPHQELQTLLFPSLVLLTPHTMAATGGDDAGLPGGPSGSPVVADGCLQCPSMLAGAAWGAWSHVG